MKHITAIQRARLRRNTQEITVSIDGYANIEVSQESETNEVYDYLSCGSYIVYPRMDRSNDAVVKCLPFSADNIFENIIVLQNYWFSKIDDCESFHKVISFDNTGVYFSVLFEQSLVNPFGRKINSRPITSPTFVSYETLAKKWCYTNGVDFFNAFIESAYEIYKSEYKSAK